MEAEHLRTPSIKKLLKSSSNEKKIAGLLMGEKLVQSISKENDAEDFLHEIITLVKPKYIIRLLYSTDLSPTQKEGLDTSHGSSLSIGCQTAIKILTVLPTSSRCLRLFKPFTSHLVDFAFCQPSPCEFLVFQQILVILKCIAAACNADNNLRLEIVDSILKKTSNFNSVDYIYVLESITDLCLFANRSTVVKRDIGVEAANSLRFLCIRSFHGGARENMRDRCINCVVRLFSNSCALSPSWTVEERELSKSEEKCLNPKEPEIGNFAYLLCSVIGIEMHLALEELISLHHHIGVVQKENEIVSQRTKELDSAYEKYIEARTNLVTENDKQGRILRGETMLIMCSCLMDQILFLLVGNEGGFTDSESSPAHWEKLSTSSLLKIRQVLHGAFCQIFEFIKEVSKLLPSFSDTCNSVRLLAYVRQCMSTLCNWILQDEDLHTLFIECMPQVISCSCISLTLLDKDICEGTEIAQSRNINYILKGLGIPGGCLNMDVAGHSLSSDIAEVARLTCAPGDVFQLVLPCLVEICSMIDQDEQHHELKDQITNSTSEYEAMEVQRGSTTISMSLDIISYFFKWKSLDLSVLMRGEGQSALPLVLGINEHELRRLLNALQQSEAVLIRVLESLHLKNADIDIVKQSLLLMYQTSLAVYNDISGVMSSI